MSKDFDDIKTQMQVFSAKHGPASILPATVLAVNDDDTIVIEFSDESQVDDARLKSVVKNGNKFLLVPAVGSIVQVARIENSDEYIVVAVDEISKLQVKIDTISVEATAAGIEIKKGEDSLKDVLTMMVEATQQIVVLQGNNPDYVKLQQAVLKINNIFS